jgi:hypothetical protein
LTAVFEDVWYGGQPATAEQLRGFRALAVDVRERSSAQTEPLAGVP